ncbi:MAG: ribosome maturation factor RimM [Solirubrobacteraceae bacterium]
MGGASAVPAGRVGRAHGLDGSFHVTAPRPRLLTSGTHVTLHGVRREIERSAGTDRAPIVRLSGIADRDGAAAVKGLELLVAVAELPALEEGEWWAHELEGCVVRDGEHRIGVVRRMLELPSCEALEVDREHGRAPLLVPMVSDAVRSVDVRGGEIDVDLSFLGDVTPPRRIDGARTVEFETRAARRRQAR